jgi:plasmid stability protein
MHTLHVRNVPDDLYSSLRENARERKSSISKETIRLLSHAVRIDRARVVQLLDEIDAGRPVARRGTPSAARLIREERDRR